MPISTKYPWFKNGLLCIMWSLPYRNQPKIPRWRLVWGTRIKYAITLFPKDIWIHVWLPKWCKSRGYYITIGLWLFSVHRGY